MSKQPTPVLVNSQQVEADLLRASFYLFVLKFWAECVPEPLIDNFHIRAICDTLQDAAERVFRNEPKKHDILINLPPGLSKSTIVSILFPAWTWTRMPTCRHICASYAHNLALDLSRRSRDVVQCDKWRNLFGDIELREDQNAKGFFINNYGGFRYCLGTLGAVTGIHSHFTNIDDPLDPNRAYSKPDLETANRWISETLSMRKVDKAVSVTVQIMQRLHQNDPSAVMLEKATRGGSPVKHINLPAEIEGDGLDVVRPRKLAQCYQHGLLDPVRLPRRVLEEARIALGPIGYAGQMLQRPVPREGAMFKVEKIGLGQPPRDILFKQRVRSWDKAGTSSKNAAFTVGVLMGVDSQGLFWVLDIVRGQWASNEREDRIFQTACLDGKGVHIVVEMEPGSGGKESAEATIRRLAGFRVRADRPVGDKELRADPYSVQVNSSNVYLKEASWNREYIEELQGFPRGKYRDQVDASSQAFAYLTQQKIKLGALFSAKPYENNANPNREETPKWALGLQSRGGQGSPSPRMSPGH